MDPGCFLSSNDLQPSPNLKQPSFGHRNSTKMLANKDHAFQKSERMIFLGSKGPVDDVQDESARRDTA
ncbi:hypothetical protein NHQ30_000854 [Ciborinia camelliae]|nr:hypothetical protein NHQ30_000854 [Ciborinia camelliae]